MSRQLLNTEARYCPKVTSLRRSRSLRSGFSLTAVAVFLLAAGAASAQAPPVDLPDLSLAELMQVEIRQGARWQIEYQYVRVWFDGYRTGTTRVADEALLAEGPPPPPPPAGRYLVLPMKIVQEAHSVVFSYNVSEKTRLGLTLPLILQTTDHASVIPGYDSFTITSEGLGDIAMVASHQLWSRGERSLVLSGGLSAPTGSIDEKGNTPRTPGDDQLPYTMQLGSGTWDVLAGLQLTDRLKERLVAGLDLSAKVRSQKNSRDYRLGDLFVASGWVDRRGPSRWVPRLEATARVWGRIDGADEELMIGGPTGFFPAPVTDPSLFGGEKLTLTAGLTARFPQDPPSSDNKTVGREIALEIGVPAYQRLNGPQPEEDWRLRARMRLSFQR